MNYWCNLVNSSLLIGLSLLLPIHSSAAPLPKDNISISQSEPFRNGEIKLDRPLPAEDVKPTNKITPSLPSTCLSKSQVLAMKTMLEEAKKSAIKGQLIDAVMMFNEFAAGLWDEAGKELKIRAPRKYNDIEARIKKIDILLSKNKPRTNTKPLRLKFIKEVTNLINAVVKAGQDC